MSGRIRHRLPHGLVVLELLGTVLLALGLLEIFAQTNFVPARWQFKDYGWYMLFAGFLLGVPHLLALMRGSRYKTESASN